MPERLIALEPIEADLTAERIDRRLALGWFPFGQRWMTCRAWPTEVGVPHDTVWLRIRLAPTRTPDRQRRLLRDGCTSTWSRQPVLDEEHQALYERFRAGRHPDWETEEAAGLLHTETRSPLLGFTREVSLRDADGRLLAFRWFVEGKTAIAGVSAVYEPSRDGLGTIARWLADDAAHKAGHTWSYPGYVRPGSPDPWTYKLKRGRTEWLDADRGVWRTWDGDEPAPDALGIAEMRRRLEARGEVALNPGWAAPCFDPESRGLPSPYYVAGPKVAGEFTVIVWDIVARRYAELRVVERQASVQ